LEEFAPTASTIGFLELPVDEAKNWWPGV